MNQLKKLPLCVVLLSFPFWLTAQIDTDNDGMPDEWEIDNGLDINDPTDALCDPDVDLVRNLFEYQLCSDPYDDQSPQHINVDTSITEAEFKILLDERHDGPPTVIRMTSGNYDLFYNLRRSEYTGESFKVMIQGGWTADHSYRQETSILGDCATILNGFNIDKGGPFISDDDHNTFILESITASYDNRIQFTNGSYPGRISYERLGTYGESIPQVIFNQAGEANRADIFVAFHAIVGASGAYVINQSGGDSISLKMLHSSLAPNFGGLPLACNLNGPSSLNVEITNCFLGADLSGNSIVCRQTGQNLGTVDITVESTRLDNIQRNLQTGITNLSNTSALFEDINGTGVDLGWVVGDGIIGYWNHKRALPYFINGTYTECDPQNGSLSITSYLSNIEFEISIDNITYSPTISGLSPGTYDMWIRTTDGCQYFRRTYALMQKLATDNDDDGMPNAWEDTNGLDSCDPTDAYCDEDGDQVINLFEYQLQTDPRDPLTPEVRQVTPQITQQEYDALIDSGIGGTLFVQFSEGDYDLLFRRDDVMEDHRILFQGGWNSDFTVYDPFTQFTNFSGASTSRNDIFILSGIDGVQWSTLIVDGFQLVEGSPAVEFRSISGQSHLSFFNCSFKIRRADVIRTRIGGEAVNQLKIINCSMQLDGSFTDANLDFSLRDDATQYADIINSSLEFVSTNGFSNYNINVGGSKDPNIFLSFDNSILIGDKSSPYYDILDIRRINIRNSRYENIYGLIEETIYATIPGSNFKTLADNSPYKEEGIDLGLAYRGAAPDLGFNAALKMTKSDFRVTVTDESCDLENGTISIEYIGYMSPDILVPFYAFYSIDGIAYTPGDITDLGEGKYDLWAKGYQDDCPIYLGEYEIINVDPDRFDKEQLRASCGESNGVITITPPGNISDYEYAIGDTTMFQSSNVFDSLIANVYLLFYRQLSNPDCIINDVFFVNQNSDIAIAVVDSTGTTCGKNNGTVTLSVSGADGLPQFFTNDGFPQASPQFESLPAGNYTFLVEDDRNCQDSVMLTLSASAGIAITDSLITQPTCGLDNGQLIIQTNDPSSVQSITLNGEPASLTVNPNLPSGDYMLLVNDDLGCSDELSFSLETSVPVEIITLDTIGTSCNLQNGTVVVTVVAGSPTEYSADGIIYVPENSIGELAPGDYLLYAQNATCADTTSFTISASTQPQLTLASFYGTDCGEDNGSVDLEVIAGTGPYTYGLDSLMNDDGQFESLPAGEYVAYVQDFSDCRDSTEVGIADSEAVVLTAAVTEGTCGELGAIELSASFGGGDNVYAGGDGNFQNGSMYTELEGGDYVFYVRTAEDCLDTLVIEVPVYGVPGITAETRLAFCEEAVGSITVSGTDGKGTLRYEFESVDQGENRNYENLSAGSYTVVVTDETGCEASQQFIVEATPKVRVEDLNAEQLFCGDVLSSVQFTPAGGTGELSYALTDSGGNMVSESEGLPEGVYRLTVTDELGCELTELIVVRKEACQIYVPTAFNPLSTGEDRTFKLGVPAASNFVIASFQIFDRWGNRIYDEKNIDPLTYTGWWDGLYYGQEVEQGVYMYVIELRGESAELIRGSITLLH